MADPRRWISARHVHDSRIGVQPVDREGALVRGVRVVADEPDTALADGQALGGHPENDRQRHHIAADRIDAGEVPTTGARQDVVRQRNEAPCSSEEVGLDARDDLVRPGIDRREDAGSGAITERAVLEDDHAILRRGDPVRPLEVERDPGDDLVRGRIDPHDDVTSLFLIRAQNDPDSAAADGHVLALRPLPLIQHHRRNDAIRVRIEPLQKGHPAAVWKLSSAGRPDRTFPRRKPASPCHPTREGGVRDPRDDLVRCRIDPQQGAAPRSVVRRHRRPKAVVREDHRAAELDGDHARHARNEWRGERRRAIIWFG